jgi:hypothetical protein
MKESAHGRELKFTELQMGALRAGASAIAAMPADEVGPQASRLCTMFAERYGWKPEEVTREVINAVERYYRAGTQANSLQGEPYHSADSPWAVVMRATAPLPRTAADRPTTGSERPLRLVQPLSAERGALHDLDDPQALPLLLPDSWLAGRTAAVCWLRLPSIPSGAGVAVLLAWGWRSLSQPLAKPLVSPVARLFQECA